MNLNSTFLNIWTVNSTLSYWMVSLLASTDHHKKHTRKTGCFENHTLSSTMEYQWKEEGLQTVPRESIHRYNTVSSNLQSDYTILCILLVDPWAVQRNMLHPLICYTIIQSMSKHQLYSNCYYAFMIFYLVNEPWVFERLIIFITGVPIRWQLHNSIEETTIGQNAVQSFGLYQKKGMINMVSKAAE